MKKILISSALAIATTALFAGCGTNKSYDFSENGCATGKHEFDSTEGYCTGLKDHSLNNGCAYQARKQAYLQECSDKGPFS